MRPRSDRMDTFCRLGWRFPSLVTLVEDLATIELADSARLRLEGRSCRRGKAWWLARPPAGCQLLDLSPGRF